jgi:hypothetical protein
MQPSKPSLLIDFLQTGVFSGALAGLALVYYGYWLAPGAGVLGFIGAGAVLIVYGLVGVFVFPAVNRNHHQIIRLACIVGLLGGAIFTSEMLLEYILLPADNSLYGLLEFGCVFSLYFLAGAAAAYHSQQVKQGVLASLISAVISSLIWAMAVLLIFYLFRGTSRQAQVFRAEGNYADFARSGSQDFNVWVLEDFMGALFFHLTLVGPLVAAVLGAIGRLLGKSVARNIKKQSRKVTV